MAFAIIVVTAVVGAAGSSQPGTPAAPTESTEVPSQTTAGAPAHPDPPASGDTGAKASPSAAPDAPPPTHAESTGDESVAATPPTGSAPAAPSPGEPVSGEPAAAVETGEAQEGSPKSDAASAPGIDTNDDTTTPGATDAVADAAEVAAAARRATEGEAAFLHADAIAAELDGDYRRALEQLRAAATLLPEDRLVAFDLARVALLRGGSDADLEAFWELTARSEQHDADETQLLRAVALRLQRQPVADQPLVDLPDWLHARLRTGLELDTNVSILPEDQPSHQLGVRYALDGLVIYRPRRDWIAIDAGLLFRLGKFLNDGALLGMYDANTFTLLGGMRVDLDWIALGTTASGTELLSGGFANQYAQMLGFQVDARVPTAGGHFGGYLSARVQDFGAGNADGTDLDRDGGEVSAGILWDWAAERFSTRGKLGWLRQFADGAKQRVQSVFVDLSARLDFEPVSGTIGLRDDVRLYERVSLIGLADDANLRVDNRLTPFVEVSVAVWEMLGVYAGYSFTANLSTSESDNDPLTRFDYLRHLVHAGVEGRL